MILHAQNAILIPRNLENKYSLQRREDKVDQKLEGLFEGVQVSPKEFLSQQSKNKAAAASRKKKISSAMGSHSTKKYNKLMSPTKKSWNGKVTHKTTAEVEADTKKAAKMKEDFKKRIDKQKKTAGKARPEQGSLGKASAEIMGVVLEAYVEALLSIINGLVLVQFLKQIPTQRNRFMGTYPLVLLLKHLI